MKRLLMTTVFAFGINTAVIAQGIPTYDVTAVSKMLEQIKQGKQQLDSMQDQLSQMKELYGSLNGLTDTSKIQDILQMPDVRNALPANFGDYEALLKGSASGAIGDTANRFRNEQSYKPSGGSAQERTHNFYQDELQKAQKHNAGQAATGEAIYKAAEEKAKAIDEIAQRLKKAETPKEVQALTAQLDAVQATLQTDVLKMQAVSMVQQAQLQAAQVREQEMFRTRLKAVADTYE